jgi:hypothetical protein
MGSDNLPGNAADAVADRQPFCSLYGFLRGGRTLRTGSTPGEADVAVFNGMFPIQAGKEEEARAFAAETVGARLAGFDAHHRRAGNVRETWTLQETPMGSFMLVWFEGDLEKAFADLATDDSEYGAWFRGRVLDLTGVDLGAPPAGPPPAVLVDWQA